MSAAHEATIAKHLRIPFPPTQTAPHPPAEYLQIMEAVRKRHGTLHTG